MFKALRTQLHVLAGLTVRGMSLQRSNLVYGYVWTFVQPAFTIVVLRIAQHLTGLYPPAGMGPLTFLATGVFPVFMFVMTMNTTAKVSRRGLCVLPRVTPIDVFVARGLLIFVRYTVLFWVFAIPSAIYDGCWPPQNPLAVQLTLMADWVLGLAMAFVFNAMIRYFPPIAEFRKFTIRPLRYISGIFFVIVSLPTWMWPWFTWNPLLHVTELMRSYWFTQYTSPVGSPEYIFAWITAGGLLGLGLERYLRRVMPE